MHCPATYNDFSCCNIQRSNVLSGVQQGWQSQKIGNLYNKQLLNAKFEQHNAKQLRSDCSGQWQSFHFISLLLVSFSPVCIILLLCSATWCKAVIPAMLIRSTSMSTLTFKQLMSTPVSSLGFQIFLVSPSSASSWLPVRRFPWCSPQKPPSQFGAHIGKFDKIHSRFRNCNLEKNNVDTHERPQVFWCYSRKFKWNSPKCSKHYLLMTPCWDGFPKHL